MFYCISYWVCDNVNLTFNVKEKFFFRLVMQNPQRWTCVVFDRYVLLCPHATILKSKNNSREKVLGKKGRCRGWSLHLLTHTGKQKGDRLCATHSATGKFNYTQFLFFCLHSKTAAEKAQRWPKHFQYFPFCMHQSFQISIESCSNKLAGFFFSFTSSHNND